MPEVSHFIAVAASTKLRRTPLVPEIQLHTADDAYQVWALTDSGDETAPMPFWSFPWAGGQALARHVLDHPDLVRGRRVLDLAAGSGLVAIAAAMAGAGHVVANDIDPFAAAAQQLNARANGVRVQTLTADILDAEGPPPLAAGEPPPLPADLLDAGATAPSLGFDVVLAGDVCYERALTDRLLAFLRRAQRGGAQVLLGDPGRTYLPRAHLQLVASYDVPTVFGLEDQHLKRTTIWRPRRN